MSVTSHSVQMDTLNAVELQRMVSNLEARLERAKNALAVKEGNTTAAVSELSAARGRGRSTARGAHHHRGASRGGRGKTPLAAAPAPPPAPVEGDAVAALAQTTAAFPGRDEHPPRHRRPAREPPLRLGPCNASVAGYVAAKANARRSVCGRFASDSPPVYQKHREVREAAAVPILWSRELVAAQEQFSNEKPFPTRKFVPFAAQLPNSSAFAGRWRGACDDCASCAVVGASGTLLREKHGAQIDAAQVVLRPNWVRTKGYEDHVGTRTSINLFFGVEQMIDQFNAAQRRKPAAERAIGLVTSGSDRSLASYFRYMYRVRNNKTSPRDQAVFLMSDRVYLRALSHLCDATGGGCTWQRKSSTMRPSTGFLAVVIALQTCRSVSLFGLTSDPCYPFHYYGPSLNGKCTDAIPAENDEHVHWFAKEHEIYAQWAREGRLRQYS